jgi:Acetyltransferase (GNAT) domain
MGGPSGGDVRCSIVTAHYGPMQSTVLDRSLPPAQSKSTTPVPATSYTLFQEPWWLDAVVPGEWEEVVVKRGGQVAARLPFVRQKKFGQTLLLQPKITPSLGPWLQSSTAKLTHRLADEKELMQQLIDALPRFDVFRQCFAPEVTYWLPFYWRGFSQTTRYSYRLLDLTNLDRISTGFRPNTRLEIRKAKKLVAVRNDLNLDSFARVWELTFARQGIRLPVSRAQLERIEMSCERRGCRKMFFAEDARGRIHAAAYVIWNADCAYYLMGGGDPELRTSGAGSLVVWEAIRFAATVSRQFDFEGSMIEPVERFFRAFGGHPVPYFSVSKLSRHMQAARGLYHVGCALLGRNPRI